MKSAPGSATAFPVGGLPARGPVLVPRIIHCAATLWSPVWAALRISNERSGKAANSLLALAARAGPDKPAAIGSLYVPPSAKVATIAAGGRWGGAFTRG